MAQTVYINGIKNDCLSINNRSIHYGDGLFETILIKNGEFTLLDLHITRLVTDAIKLGFKGVTVNKIQALLKPLVALYPNAIVKLIVARNQKKRGYAITKNSGFDTIISINDIPQKKVLLNAIICNLKLASQPALAKIKHLNRLEQVLASNELEQGVDEGVLFLHEKDQLVETISSNIFIIKNQKVSTPLLNEAGVEGVAKNIIIQMAKEQGIIISETNISKKELDNADCVFISNSIFGLRLIRQIGDKQYNIDHSLFKTLHNQTKSYFVE